MQWNGQTAQLEVWILEAKEKYFFSVVETHAQQLSVDLLFDICHNAQLSFKFCYLQHVNSYCNLTKLSWSKTYKGFYLHLHSVGGIYLQEWEKVVGQQIGWFCMSEDFFISASNSQELTGATNKIYFPNTSLKKCYLCIRGCQYIKWKQLTFLKDQQLITWNISFFFHLNQNALSLFFESDSNRRVILPASIYEI